MRGMVSDIIPFSLHDGPGIRTTVFLKGCPLRCQWCHNPETWSPRPQPMRATTKCAGCGRCAGACPLGLRGPDGAMLRPGDCVGCGRCAGVCPNGAIRMSGRWMEAAEAAETVLRDRPFFIRSGGGATLSGGEPLAQPDFALELLDLLRREGVHTAVETSGYCPTEVMRRAAGTADLFLFDCKETDPALHRRWTGVAPDRILDNLRLLAELGAPVVLRCPIVPGYNDREDHLRAIAALAASLGNIRDVQLMPYHRAGLSKASQLGLSQPDDIPEPTDAMKERWMEILRQAGGGLRIG